MIVLYVDGLCEPINPGGIMACGVVAYRGKQRILEASTAWASTPSSNNIAEYAACIHGLRLLSDMGLTSEEVVVCSDSQLMVRQINGEYAVHSENIAGPYYQVQQLASLFHKIRFRWVPREQNTEADALSRQAYKAWIEENPELFRERYGTYMASQKQIAFLRRLNITPPPYVSKQEASRLIGDALKHGKSPSRHSRLGRCNFEKDE